MFVLGLLALILPAVAASQSKANEYEVWSCVGPAGQPLSMAAWTPQTNDAAMGEVWMTNDCLTGGPAGLHVNDLGVAGSRRARIDLRFNLPRDEKISGYRLNRAISAAASFSGYTYAAAVRETALGMTDDKGCASYLALPDFNCSNLGSHVNFNDPGNEYIRSGLDLDGLSVWAGCLSNGCSPPFSPPAARFSLFQSVVSIVDNDPPSLIATRGSITRPGPVSGIADLYVDSADTGSGVRTLSLSIDGVPYDSITIDTSPTCVDPFEVPRPCPAETGQIFPIDADQLTPGPHTATGQIIDAAGNTAPFGPIEFTAGSVNPGPPVPDNGVPAVEDPLLKFDRQVFQHTPGKTASVTGRLTTSGGAPVSGARLEVMSSSIGTLSTVDRPLPAVTTGTDGRFTISIRGDGAQRLEVSFAPVTGGLASRTASVTVRSRLSVQLKAKPRRIRIGKAVKFRGRILGGGTSLTGANTEIQAISGGRWQTVANVRAKKGGKFTWKYRFRYVERNAIFSFRAVLRGNPGWPWPTVKSKKIKVRIKVPRA